MFTPFGLILSNKNQKNLDYFSTQLLYGLIVLSFIGLFFNFFFSLNKYLNTLILFIPLILLILKKNIYLNKQFIIFLVISSIIISLLVLESDVYRPDAGLYHLPYTKILNDEKIIFGLSNLHFRYSHISIIQYLSAISNNVIFTDNGIVFAQALIASAVIINFSYKIFIYNKNKDYNFHFFYLFGLLIFISYKMNRYGEYGNDAPSHFLLFFLISEIIVTKKDNIRDICNNFILISFIIFNKITLLMCVFLGFVSLDKISIKKIFLLKRFYFLLFFIFLWITKNVIVSGCLLYPVKFSCYEKLIWSNKNQVKNVSIENEAWTKGWPDYVKIQNLNDKTKISQEDYSKEFYWLPYWSNGHLKKITSILLPYLIFLLFITIYLNYYKISKKKLIINKTYLYIIFIMIVATILWFVKVPVFRYGYSYFISVISLIFSYICIHFIDFKKQVQKFLNLLLIFCISIITIKNVVRIIKTDNNYSNHPWPKYFAMNQSNIKQENKEIIINGKKFYEPKKNEYCMYSNSPCGHDGNGIRKNLDLILKKKYIILYSKN